MKNGRRSVVRYRGGGNRSSTGFALFLVVGVVVLIAVFLVGFQVGRVVERKTPRQEPPPPAVVRGKVPPPPVAADIEREMGSFSAEAENTPSVQPPTPSALEEAKAPVATESTFRKTLGKKGEIVPLKPESPKETARASKDGRSGKGVFVGAGRFKEEKNAESAKRKLDALGIKSRIEETDEFFVLVAGPFEDDDAAKDAVRRLKKAKIKAVVLKG